MLLSWFPGLAFGEPTCGDPAPRHLAECLHAASPGSVDSVVAAAAALLDGAHRAEALEALQAVLITSPPHVRTAAAALLVERGLLATATVARIPGPPEVDRQIAQALSRVDVWPRTDLQPPTRGCVVTGEAAPGVLELRCTAHTCGSACMAFHFDATYRVDASGWHVQTVGSRAGDDGSCGCCMPFE
jgi:hypothetical protein